MDCQTAQEQILDPFDEPRSVGNQQAIDAHLANCLTCAGFAAKQKTIDARLNAMLTAPEMSPALRSFLLKRIRWERMRFWSEALPDIVHFASCAGATVVCSLIVPFGTAVIFAAGTITALLAYIMLTIVRDSLQDVE